MKYGKGNKQVNQSTDHFRCTYTEKKKNGKQTGRNKNVYM